MEERRQDRALTTADYEDRGLFNEKVSEKKMDLLPRMTRNSRGDVVIMGESEQGIEVEVIFPGRRAADAAPLMRRLKSMGASERARLPVRVEGVFRPRFHRDKTGWETKSYQLIAARWLMFDEHGTARVYGEMPIQEVRRTSAS